MTDDRHQTDDEQPRDEGGQFVPSDPGVDDDRHQTDDEGGDDATATASADGGAERPPARNFSEREVRAFLRELFEQTAEWRGASDGRSAMPPQSHGDARGDAGAVDPGDCPAAGQILVDDDVEALTEAGYSLRQLSALEAGGRTSTDSYELVAVEPDDEDDPPEQSVADVLGVDDE